MKTFELDDYCMQELNTKEINETDGGFLIVDTIVAIIELYNAIEVAKKYRLLQLVHHADEAINNKILQEKPAAEMKCRTKNKKL